MFLFNGSKVIPEETVGNGWKRLGGVTALGNLGIVFEIISAHLSPELLKFICFLPCQVHHPTVSNRFPWDAFEPLKKKLIFLN